MLASELPLPAEFLVIRAELGTLPSACGGPEGKCGVRNRIPPGPWQDPSAHPQSSAQLSQKDQTPLCTMEETGSLS